jgi:hypothetical protein
MTSRGASGADPIIGLEHDHSHLSALVTSLREALVAARAASDVNDLRFELSDALRLLRDDLFTHFAREEEGLFPLVLLELPDLTPIVATVVAAHDRICGAVSRMTYVLDKGGDGLGAELDALLALFERFDEAYTAHARDELELLRTLDRRLDGRQRVSVANVLKGL